MITYRAHDDIYEPTILCDACQQPITGAGNVYWLVGESGAVIDPNVWHTHKHPCSGYDKHLEAWHGGMVFSEELDRWLDQLAHNFATTVDQ